MRKLLAMAAVATAIVALPLLAATPESAPVQKATFSATEHRVVFDVSSAEESWDGILNNVENVVKAFAPRKNEIEVVVHGKALGLVLKSDTKRSERLASLMQKGVGFAACRNTMARQKVTTADLQKGITTVDSGVAEVIRKQEAGWAYVKAGD